MSLPIINVLAFVTSASLAWINFRLWQDHKLVISMVAIVLCGSAALANAVVIILKLIYL